ncbi:DUF6415 family natural product biosynthesis protein [Streptomyces sp. NPDC058678]|uniref:DUF6415 family natural product biosynthesis protein n=1 Tax=Streptomyces sp. NPDC058678 TaxID=3346595 RepID=UPI003663FE6C
MTTSTTHPPAAEEQNHAPPDIETMRATALRLLGPDDGPDVLPPAADELDTLTLALRGHLELLGPEVERMAGRLDRESIPRYCALACVGEARGKLRARPGRGPHGPVAYARRLARVLNALCDHHEKLPQSGGSRG